ncbi:hypothetical protein BDC45DRAFT_502549 [Circinella umbellata]|nr:hypothetical protein BDC45DRAFT_502549 [Circinella umbellata]
MVHRSASLQQQYNADDYYNYYYDNNLDDDPYYYYETSTTSPARRQPEKSKSTITTKSARRAKRSSSLSGEARPRRRSSVGKKDTAGSNTPSIKINKNNKKGRVKNNNNNLDHQEDYSYYDDQMPPWGRMKEETLPPQAGVGGPMFNGHDLYNDDYMYYSNLTPWLHGPTLPNDYADDNALSHHSSFSIGPQRRSSTSSTAKKKRRSFSVSTPLSPTQTVIDNNSTIFISDEPFDDTSYVPQQRSIIQNSTAANFHSPYHEQQQQQQQENSDHHGHTIQRRHSLYEHPSASMLMSPMMQEHQDHMLPMTPGNRPPPQWISPMGPDVMAQQNFPINNFNSQLPIMQQPLSLPMSSMVPPPPLRRGIMQPINQFSTTVPIMSGPQFMMPLPPISGMPGGGYPQPIMPPMVPPSLGGPLGLPPPFPGMGEPPLHDIGGLPLLPPFPPGPIEPRSPGPPTIIPPPATVVGATTIAGTRAISPITKIEDSKPKDTSKSKEVVIANPKGGAKPKEDSKPKEELKSKEIKSKSPVKKEEPKVEKLKEEPPKAEINSASPSAPVSIEKEGSSDIPVAAAVEKASKEKKEEAVAREMVEETVMSAAPPKADPPLRRSLSLFGGWLGGRGVRGASSSDTSTVKKRVPVHDMSRWDPASVMAIEDAVLPPKASSMAVNTRGRVQPVFVAGHPLNQHLPLEPNPMPIKRSNTTLTRKESTRVMTKAEQLGMRQFIWCYRPMDPVSAEAPTIVWAAFDLRNQQLLDPFIPAVVHRQHPSDPFATVFLNSQKDLPGQTIVKPIMEIGYNYRRAMSSKALRLEVVCLPNNDPGKLMVRNPNARNDDENLDTAPGLSFAPNPGFTEKLRRTLF